MCNKSVPSVTLQSAVLMQVQEFAANNQTFSAHDITRNIRNKANSGEWEIPEVQMTGASFKNDIPHVKVKDLFKDLWQTGAFDQFLTLTDRFNGKYYEYTPTLVGTSATAPVQTSASPSPSAQGSTSPLTVPPSPQKDVPDRIRMYLANCAARNFRPTIRQVQSAIKRGNSSSGWTCEQIRDHIENVLAINVISDPDFVSASQVVVV